MANGNGKKNVEDTVAFSNIFDFTDTLLGEKYTRRREPVVGTPETRKGKEIDTIIPDQKNRGWMSSWEKGRKRVATSPVSFHADEVLPMMEGLFNTSEKLGEPFRDIKGNLFGGSGKQRRGPMYGLSLDVRMKSLVGDVKRGDDIVDCYVRGLETPTRRKTYALQQPPGRSYGLSGQTRDQRDNDARAMNTTIENEKMKAVNQQLQSQLEGLVSIEKERKDMRRQAEAMGLRTSSPRTSSKPEKTIS